MYLLDETLKYLAKDKLSVLLFHAVPPKAPALVDDLDIEAVARVLDFFEKRFNIVPLDAAVEGIKAGKVPPRTACITFDDGYASWFTGIVPLLQKRNLHATFFLTAGQFDGLPMWHERVAHAVRHLPGTQLDLPGFGLPPLDLSDEPARRRALQLVEQFLKYQKLETREVLLGRLEQAAGVTPAQLPRMTADQVRELKNRGFGIGAHTMLHPILSLCDPHSAMNEIGEVRERLEGIVGGRVDSFAYPNGRPSIDFSAEHVRLVQAAGYSHAVTTQWGAANARTPIFEIPRFTPWGPDERRMRLQVARNLRTEPRYTARRAAQTASDDRRKPVVLYVENGAGFGGAVVALQTLLGALPASSGSCHVTTNMRVSGFDGIAAVKSYRVITDRLFNFKEVAKAIHAAGLGPLGRLLLFLVGRLDDVVNRLPYFTRLALHAFRLRPDIIHGNNEPSSNREAMLVAKLLGVPYVQHVRGALGSSKRSPWLLAGPNTFIPVSRWLAGELMLSGVSSERVRQVYDAIQFAEPQPGSASDLRRSLGLSPETVLVAMVGMLVSWKGQDLFIDAVRLVRAGARPVAYLIVGGTPERGDPSYADGLRDRAKTQGLEDRIHFLGRRSDLAVLLPQIEVVVSASTEPEPLGLVMLEAMASGCVFVGPAFGAANEVVQDGVNGHLFVPRSSTSLAEKLTLAIAESADSAELRGAAQRSVRQQFSGAACADETQRVYQSFLD